MINTSSQLRLRIGAAVLAVLMVSFLALRVSAAAFSDTTTTPETRSPPAMSSSSTTTVALPCSRRAI